MRMPIDTPTSGISVRNGATPIEAAASFMAAIDCDSGSGDVEHAADGNATPVL